VKGEQEQLKFDRQPQEKRKKMRSPSLGTPFPSAPGLYSPTLLFSTSINSPTLHFKKKKRKNESRNQPLVYKKPKLEPTNQKAGSKNLQTLP
jgi:hypothetical protein